MAIISIIDDNTSILTSLSLQFQSKGYKTITFADPEKALLYHEDKPADAYVIDMKMPRLTGFERTGFSWVVLHLRPQVPKHKKPLFSHSIKSK